MLFDGILINLFLRTIDIINNKTNQEITNSLKNTYKLTTTITDELYEETESEELMLVRGTYRIL